MKQLSPNGRKASSCTSFQQSGAGCLIRRRPLLVTSRNFIPALFALLIVLSTSAVNAGDYVLVVDTSGSMKDRVSGKDNRIRGAVVQSALREYLPALPWPSRVYLIAFNTGIVSEKEIVLKDQESLAAGLNWVNDLSILARRGGNTYLWTTLRKALQIASAYSEQTPGQPVVVRVLTDGEDNQGVTSLDRVLKEFPLVDGEHIRGNLVLLGDLELKTKLTLPEGAFETTKNTQWTDLFPPVILSFPSQPKAGDEVRFVENTHSIYAGYQWSIDNKPVGKEKVLTWRFPEARVYRVTLTVRGLNGSDNSNTILVSVGEQEKFSVELIGSGANAQPGEPIRFMARPSAKAVQFRWFIDSVLASTNADLTFRSDKEGDFQIKVIAQNNRSIDASNALTCSVKEAPLVVTIKAPTEATAGQSVQFAGQISGPVARVLWQFADGTTSTDQDPIHSFAIDGPTSKDFSVTLRVTSPAGHAVEAVPHVIRVQAPVVARPPRAAFNIIEQHLRVGEPLHLVDQSDGYIESRRWEISGEPDSSDTSPVIQFTRTGKKTITLKVVGPGGADQVSKEIIVQPRFERVSVKIAASKTSGNAPLVVQFKSMITGDVKSILWRFGDGQSSTNRNPQHEFAVVTNCTTVASVVPADHAQSPVEERISISVAKPWPMWAKAAVALIALLCLLGSGLFLIRHRQQEKMRLPVYYWPQDATVCQRVDLTAANEVTNLSPSVPLQIRRMGGTTSLAVQPLDGAILMSSDGREVPSVDVAHGARVLVKTSSGSPKAVAIAANAKPQRPLPATEEVADVGQPVAVEQSAGGDFDWRW